MEVCFAGNLFKDTFKPLESDYLNVVAVKGSMKKILLLIMFSQFCFEFFLELCSVVVGEREVDLLKKKTWKTSASAQKEATTSCVSGYFV